MTGGLTMYLQLLARAVELVKNELTEVTIVERHKTFLVVIEAKPEDPLEADLTDRELDDLCQGRPILITFTE